jgi:hypothetical protein
MENAKIILISILSGTTTYFLMSWLNERSYRKLEKVEKLYYKEKSEVLDELLKLIKNTLELDKKPKKEKKNEPKRR